MWATPTSYSEDKTNSICRLLWSKFSVLHIYLGFKFLNELFFQGWYVSSPVVFHPGKGPEDDSLWTA